jgi:hypothetical protein
MSRASDGTAAKTTSPEMERPRGASHDQGTVLPSPEGTGKTMAGGCFLSTQAGLAKGEATGCLGSPARKRGRTNPEKSRIRRTHMLQRRLFTRMSPCPS